MHYLLLWAIALFCFGFGLYCREEVMRITGAMMGGAIALYGLVSAPTSVQIVVEVVTMVSGLSFCMRYCRNAR